MNWKILSSEYLTRYFYFTARKDVCETPEGKIIDPYYVVEQDPSVCALGITEDGFALMVKQYRHPIEQTILEIPGGFIDKGESPLEAVAREMLEETGYEFSSYEQVCEIASNPGLLSSLTKGYLATGGRKVGEQKLDKNEEIEIVLIPLEELVEMFLQNKIVQALHTCCIFYALLKLGKVR